MGMMLGEEKKEVGRRKRKGGASGREGKQLQCSHCQLQLDTIGELRTHVKVMHEEQKTYQCTECNIKVSRKYHLVRHIKCIKKRSFGNVRTVTTRQIIRCATKNIRTTNMRGRIVTLFIVLTALQSLKEMRVY